MTDQAVTLSNKADEMFPTMLGITLAEGVASDAIDYSKAQLKIHDGTELQIATENMNTIKAWFAEVDNHYDPLIKSAKETVRLATEAKGKTRLKGENALALISAACTTYVIEDRRKRDEQARIDAQKAEQEENDRKEREKAKLQKAGATEETIAAIEERAPAPLPPPRKAAPAPAPKGLVTRDNWSAVPDTNSGNAHEDEIKGRNAILKQLGVTAKMVKERGWLLQFLTVDRSALNSHAKSTKTQFAVDGWKAVNNPTTHTRS